jgi:hypothetical protein
MAREFKLSKSVHSMPCITASDLTLKECDIIAAVMRDNYSYSDGYKLRTACAAFLQGCLPPHNGTRCDGWILIEFWGKDEIATDKFIRYVNRKLAEAEVCDDCGQHDDGHTHLHSPRN